MVWPAGTDQTADDAHLTEVEGDAYQQSVVMETADADEQVPDGGDIQSELEAVAESMTSLALSKVSAEQINDDDEVNELADDDAGREVDTGGDQVDDDNEFADSETATLQRHSPGDSTEPPPASSHSPEPGTVQVTLSPHTQCPTSHP